LYLYFNDRYRFIENYNLYFTEEIYVDNTICNLLYISMDNHNMNFNDTYIYVDNCILSANIDQ